MADGIIVVPDIASGKKIDNTELAVAGNTVERQRINDADPTDPAGLARVLAADPSRSDYGKVVRAITPTASAPTVASVAGSASSVTLLAANTARRMATFFNDSIATLYLKFGATASSSSYTVKLSPGDYFELPLPIYTGVIDGIWSSATGNCQVTEIT